jgi:hypothetical protein
MITSPHEVQNGQVASEDGGPLDIVKRLRARADAHSKMFGNYYLYGLSDRDVDAEAAHTIERLREDLLEERRRLGSALKALHAAHGTEL